MKRRATRPNWLHRLLERWAEPTPTLDAADLGTTIGMEFVLDEPPRRMVWRARALPPAPPGPDTRPWL